MNVHIDSSNTEKLADEMLLVLEQFQNNIKALNNVIDKISIDWQGNDATKFVDTMKNKNIVELEKLHEKLREYILFLRKVPTAYQLLDEAFVARGIDV